MKELFFHIIENIALGIGVIGILVIFIGSIQALWKYITQSADCFIEVRIILGTHLIVGLDFLVGKDVIDTILLNPGKDFYEHLLALITIVIIRIILSHVVIQELEYLENKNKNQYRKKKKRSFGFSSILKK